MRYCLRKSFFRSVSHSVHFSGERLVTAAVLCLLFSSGAVQHAKADSKDVYYPPPMSIPGDDEAGDLISLANRQVRDADFGAAEDMLKRAQRFDPGDRRVNVALGLLFYATGRSRRAEAEFNSIAAASNASANAFYEDILDGPGREDGAGFDASSLDVLRSARKNMVRELAPPGFAYSGIGALSRTEGAAPFRAEEASRCSAGAAKSALFQWRSWWEGRLFDRYVSAYAADYRGQYASRRLWIKARQKAILGAEKIELAIDGLSVDVRPGCKATAVFNQYYRSGNHADLGEKTIEMRLIGSQWVIVDEKWKPHSD